MSNILKWSLKNALIGLSAIFCALVIVCAFLAPVLIHSNFALAGNAVYDFLHKLCKMHGTNIFTILGQPIGICARCIGAYITGGLVLHFYLHKYKMNKVLFIIIGTLAFGEIVAEYFNLFYANDFIRLLDGFFLGAFLGMLLIKILDWLEGKKGW
jgi:membrane-bound acyltransferase YfiQ involved in biofilm formation